MSESKEPGQLAYETFSGDRWVDLPPQQRWHWSRVESAIRADEREKAVRVVQGKLYPGAGGAFDNAYNDALRTAVAAIRAAKEGA